MSWRQLVFPLGELSLTELESALADCKVQAISLADAGDEPLFEPDAEQPALWKQTRVTVLLDAAADIDRILLRLTSSFGALPEYRVETLKDRDWEREWLRDFKPMKFGRRLWIVPSAFTPPDLEAVNLLLDPGLAFGTGTHATTALCLEWLDANATFYAGEELIDYGCGSGVLGIAAALLGARRVFAVDIDPQALSATHANARANRVDHALQIGTLPAAPCRFLVANILAGPLVKLAPRFAELLQPGGGLLLSGILAAQGTEIRNAYSRWFTMVAENQRDDWLCIHAVRTE